VVHCIPVCLIEAAPPADTAQYVRKAFQQTDKVISAEQGFQYLDSADGRTM
jgi:hypothetical protein